MYGKVYHMVHPFYIYKIMISAKIIKDSRHPNGTRLVTFLLRYPRIIHSELKTHRVFSTNSSSSRAIPTSTFIKQVEDDPFIPPLFLKNISGMKGGAEIEEVDRAIEVWKEACKNAVGSARTLAALEVHKQTVNRLLEPFCHIETILSGTEFTNFFNLRCHPDAQPEIRALADAMMTEMHKSVPTSLDYGDWHLPFGDSKERTSENTIKSVVCCARVSYQRHLSISTEEKDAELYFRLINSEPIHASPLEHIACVVLPNNGNDRKSSNRNFCDGWMQWRHVIEYNKGLVR